MHPFFEDFQVRVFALSKDSPEEVRSQQQRDTFQHLTLLSDPRMHAIQEMGLTHHKAIEFKTWSLFGVPLGYPSGFKSMAIPTTLLIDEQGIVRWIDQADDYRLRGDQQRIKDALQQAFPD